MADSLIVIDCFSPSLSLSSPLLDYITLARPSSSYQPVSSNTRAASGAMKLISIIHLVRSLFHSRGSARSKFDNGFEALSSRRPRICMVTVWRGGVLILLYACGTKNTRSKWHFNYLTRLSCFWKVRN